MLQAGMRLGDRYRLAARLGAGGMGEVWRAVDEVLGRTVAVKAMLPSVAADPGFARRFLAEATAMARVNHPAVASIHDYGRSGDVPYLVMEFVEGESLAQVLARTGRLGPAETMRLVAQAADGLQAVHDRGVVHRDIKPANLMVRPDGSVLITDFGIARADDASRLTASGAVLGTPTYLSPEQVLGQPATARSDVYSLGLTAYECLAGRRPFTGDNPYAVALQRLQDAPRTIGIALPPAVLAVVEGALAVDPAHRWPSAAAMAEAARAAVESGSTGDRGGPPDRAAAPARSRSRRPALLAGLAAILLLTAGLTAWMTSREGETGAAAPSTGTGRSANAAAPTPAGFTACDGALCPTGPLCFGGLNAIGGRAEEPRRIDCAQTHVWETFAAVPVPATVATEVRQDELLERADVAAACSPDAMAARSRDPGTTRSWVRDAWPVETGDGTWLVHCIARPDAGSPDGPAFRAG
jgi:hypothetical protein